MDSDLNVQQWPVSKPKASVRVHPLTGSEVIVNRTRIAPVISRLAYRLIDNWSLFKQPLFGPQLPLNAKRVVLPRPSNPINEWEWVSSSADVNLSLSHLSHIVYWFEASKQLRADAASLGFHEQRWIHADVLTCWWLHHRPTFWSQRLMLMHKHPLTSGWDASACPLTDSATMWPEHERPRPPSFPKPYHLFSVPKQPQCWNITLIKSWVLEPSWSRQRQHPNTNI